jgi:hypothetical protein
VLNSVSEKVARGRNDKLEEDLLSTYAALEHTARRVNTFSLLWVRLFATGS